MKNNFFIKRILILIAIVAILALSLLLFPNDKVVLKIGDTRLLVEVVDTQKERIQGLSGREGLEKNNGMLFVFDNEDSHGIWMKDMNFAIDILWIDSDFNIVNIKKYANPESYPEIFLPQTPNKYVLEVNVGFLEKNDIKIGDKINF
jgi:uncharacterized protein